MKKIKVLIADDHTIVRLGLKALFDAEDGFETVGAAKNGLEAVALAERMRPDVVVMDLLMPRMDGVEATRELRRKLPSARVVILTSFGASDGIDQALKAGAAGAVMKTEDESLLVAAVRRIAAGETYVSPEIRQQFAVDPPVPALTPRQLDVLQSLVRGLTNSEIALQLDIRKDGVEDHVNAIFSKLGASNRAEAVAIALRKNLLRNPPTWDSGGGH